MADNNKDEDDELLDALDDDDPELLALEDDLEDEDDDDGLPALPPMTNGPSDLELAMQKAEEEGLAAAKAEEEQRQKLVDAEEAEMNRHNAKLDRTAELFEEVCGRDDDERPQPPPSTRPHLPGDKCDRILIVMDSRERTGRCRRVEYLRKYLASPTVKKDGFAGRILVATKEDFQKVRTAVRAVGDPVMEPQAPMPHLDHLVLKILKASALRNETLNVSDIMYIRDDGVPLDAKEHKTFNDVYDCILGKSRAHFNAQLLRLYFLATGRRLGSDWEDLGEPVERPLDNQMGYCKVGIVISEIPSSMSVEAAKAIITKRSGSCLQWDWIPTVSGGEFGQSAKDVEGELFAAYLYREACRLLDSEARLRTYGSIRAADIQTMVIKTTAKDLSAIDALTAMLTSFFGPETVKAILTTGCTSIATLVLWMVNNGVKGISDIPMSSATDKRKRTVGHEAGKRLHRILGLDDMEEVAPNQVANPDMPAPEIDKPESSKRKRASGSSSKDKKKKKNDESGDKDDPIEFSDQEEVTQKPKKVSRAPPKNTSVVITTTMSNDDKDW